MQEDVLYALNEDDACATLGMDKAKAKDKDKLVYLLTADGAPTESMRYLKTVFASTSSSSSDSQWSNFIERVKQLAAEHPDITPQQKDHVRYLEVSEYHFMKGEVLHPLKDELLLWASNRGQLLARTVRGMMAYRRALLVHADMECPPLGPVSGPEGGVGAAKLRQLLLEELVDRKYQYVLSGQALSLMAGNKSSLKAQWTVHSMKLLAERHPSLKIASIDRQLLMADKLGELKLTRDYSVLLRSSRELDLKRAAGLMVGSEAYRYSI
jgi:hypothetical protein